MTDATKRAWEMAFALELALLEAAKETSANDAEERRMLYELLRQANEIMRALGAGPQSVAGYIGAPRAIHERLP